MTTTKQADVYVVRVGDAQVGPVTLDQLRRGLKAGKIPAYAEAKAVEGEDWKPASEVAMRIVLPPPRSPPNPRQPEPSWSAFQGGEVVTPSDAPPVPLSPGGAAPPGRSVDSLAAPTRTFSRPMYMLFVPGSMDPPTGPFRASALKARMESGATPPNAQVCEVDEHACWIPIGGVFDE